MFDENVRQTVKGIKNKSCKNNTQRVCLALLKSRTKWIAKSNMSIPSVTARLRDLRKPQFGGFEVECIRAAKLNREGKDTFYRLNPDSVTVDKLNKLFKGVV